MSATAIVPTTSGWRARLALAFVRGAGRTLMRRLESFGPLYVQKPFHPEGHVLHAYLLHPPGGVVGGDELEISVDVGPGAAGLVTTPAAGKFYASAGPVARQAQTLRVAADAALEWLPQETIFFRGCRAAVRTAVLLEPGARFIGWDVACLGRPAAGDCFDTGDVSVWLGLYRGEAGREACPLLIEHQRWSGGSAVLDEPFGLAGYRVSGALYATPADPDLLDLLRRRDHDSPRPPDGLTGLSVVDDVLVARVLAREAETARGWLGRVWAGLRPIVLGRAACPPRVWNT